MAFVSSLTQDDANKKPGDLIKSADWNAVVGEVVALGKAKLDRDGDTLYGELNVAGTLAVDGVVQASALTVTPGDASAGLWLEESGEHTWGLYHRGGALRIRTAADTESGLLVENQDEQLNLSVRASDGETFVRGALTIAGADMVLYGQKSRNGTEHSRTGSALGDGGAEDGLVINRANNFGKVTVEGELNVNGPVRAAAFIYNNQMVHRMYPAAPLIYEDILEAMQQGVIAKLGNPGVASNWNTRYTGQNLWNGRALVQFGSNNDSDGNGAVVTIPDGYDTLWIRLPGTSWNALKAYLLSDNALQKDLGMWVGGWRSHSIDPDGTNSSSLAHDTQPANQWLAIPVGQAGRVVLVSKPRTDDNFWLSGVAFSRNPWAHAAQSAVSYHWGLNGTENGVNWTSHNWWGDVGANLPGGTSLAMQVPVLPSGRDKLLYFISGPFYIWQSGRYEEDIQHTAVLVNGKPIERFLSTYNTPFSRYWNSRPACRYYAARIPAELIPTTTRFLKVQIDLSKQAGILDFDFREIGTHDLEIPLQS